MPSLADQKRLNRATRAAGNPKSKAMQAGDGGLKDIEDHVRLVAGILNYFMFECIATERERSDLRRLLPQITAAMPETGGVLVLRFVGERSSEAETVHYEYIGLRVAGTGADATDAIISYHHRKQDAEKQPSPKSPDMCYPEDVVPKSLSEGKAFRAAPTGMNDNYEKEFSDRFTVRREGRQEHQEQCPRGGR